MIDAGPDVQGQDDYQRAPFTVASDNEDARLQKEYRVLFDRLQESEKTIEISGVKEIIDEANTLFRNVKSIKGAALDSSLLVKAVNISSQVIHRLEPTGGIFSISEWLDKVRATMLPSTKEIAISGNFGGASATKFSELDWDALGPLAEEVLNVAPACEFMLGPLKLKPKARLAQRRAGKLIASDSSLMQPKLVNKDDLEKRELETTTVVKKIHDILKTVAPLPYFEFVINPSSFAQTIENIFYVSFLVHDGRCFIYKSDDGELFLGIAKAPQDSNYADGDGTPLQQSVISINHGEWEDLVCIYDIKSSRIPSRGP